MRVVVTGGTGHAGASIVRDLVEHGYDVLNVDRVKPAHAISAFRFADLQDLGQAFGCLHGADAVIHFAAIPRPVFDTDEVVYRTNTMTTFNVLEAATQLKVPRVVLASSMSVLGYPFYYRYFAPEYVPMDENHPLKPQDPYALSKVVGEVLAQGFARRSDLTVVSLRLGWIHTPETFREQIVPWWEEPGAGASNLWAYIDSRDSAQACRLALTAPLKGHEAFFISAPNSFMKIPTAELVRKYYPETPIPPEWDGTPALLSTAKAEKMLGFHAEHLWQSYF